MASAQNGGMDQDVVSDADYSTVCAGKKAAFAVYNEAPVDEGTQNDS